MIFKDLRLRSSFMASQQETEDMLNAVVKYNIHVENNVFWGLDEIPRAVEMLKKAEYRGKACFIVDKDAVGVEPGDGRV
jgi:alcohol dehydrogenase, propanol-preferring